MNVEELQRHLTERIEPEPLTGERLAAIEQRAQHRRNVARTRRAALVAVGILGLAATLGAYHGHATAPGVRIEQPAHRDESAESTTATIGAFVERPQPPKQTFLGAADPAFVNAVREIVPVGYRLRDSSASKDAAGDTMQNVTFFDSEQRRIGVGIETFPRPIDIAALMAGQRATPTDHVGVYVLKDTPGDAEVGARAASGALILATSGSGPSVDSPDAVDARVLQSIAVAIQPGF